ncbi:MAG: peptidoglycan bridge formation glycyltransferase FemA/FemB family protein [Anaerolineales bacterium]
MPEVSLSEWNAFLSHHPAAHLLQSGEWGQLKSAFGWEAIYIIEGDTGAQILFRHLPLGFTLAYLPKGPVTETVPNQGFWLALDNACRTRRAVFLKIEPNGWEEQGLASIYNRQGLIPSLQHIQPRNTLVIDLHGSEDDIFDRMKPKTRYNIRLAGRKEVVVHPTEDIETFYSVMTMTGQREEFNVHSKEYYRRAYELFYPKRMCELFLADFQGRTLACLMVFARSKQAYYFYGASSDFERNRKATYPLQWEAIRWARAQGCEEYDMWGIPDEATDVAEDDAEAREDGLWGVYRFKRGFGGSIKHAIPTMDRIYNPLLYKLYQWRFPASGAD